MLHADCVELAMARCLWRVLLEQVNEVVRGSLFARHMQHEALDPSIFVYCDMVVLRQRVVLCY